MLLRVGLSMNGRRRLMHNRVDRVGLNSSQLPKSRLFRKRLFKVLWRSDEEQPGRDETWSSLKLSGNVEGLQAYKKLAPQAIVNKQPLMGQILLDPCERWDRGRGRNHEESVAARERFSSRQSVPRTSSRPRFSQSLLLRNFLAMHGKACRLWRVDLTNFHGTFNVNKHLMCHGVHGAQDTTSLNPKLHACYLWDFTSAIARRYACQPYPKQTSPHGACSRGIFGFWGLGFGA